MVASIFSFCEHTHVTHFVSTLLLALALTLTFCFGVATWRQSAGKDVDITATMPLACLLIVAKVFVERMIHIRIERTSLGGWSCL